MTYLYGQKSKPAAFVNRITYVSEHTKSVKKAEKSREFSKLVHTRVSKVVADHDNLVTH